MIVIRHISKKYNDVLILDNYSIMYQNRGLFLLEGRNGSGKTTLLNIISGFDKDYEGTILINDIEISHSKRRKLIHYLYQDFVLFEKLTGHEHIKLFFNIKKLNIDTELINTLVHDFDLQDILNNKIHTYSVGQKRKLQFIHAIITKKKIILLDEPFSQIDTKSIQVMMAYMEELSKTKLVIYTQHEDFLLNTKTTIQEDILYGLKPQRYQLGFGYNLFKKNLIILLSIFIMMILGFTIILSLSSLRAYDKNHIAKSFYDNLNYAVLNSSESESNAKLYNQIMFEMTLLGIDTYNLNVLSSNNLNTLELEVGRYPTNSEEVLISFAFMELIINDTNIENANELLEMAIDLDSNEMLIVGVVKDIFKSPIFKDDNLKQVYTDSNPFIFVENNDFNGIYYAPVNLLSNTTLKQIDAANLVKKGNLFNIFSSELSMNNQISENVIIIVLVMVIIVAVISAQLYFRNNIYFLQKYMMFGISVLKAITYAALYFIFVYMCSFVVSYMISNVIIKLENLQIMDLFLLHIDPFQMKTLSLYMIFLPIILALATFILKMTNYFKVNKLLKVNIND